MARIAPIVWTSPANRGLVGRIATPLKKVGGKSFWALADQAASSAGNFLTNIMLARTLARESFGTFGLILEGIFFLNAIQSAFVTYPLSVRGASGTKASLSKYTTISLILTLVLAAPVVLVTMVAGVASHNAVLALSAAIALVAWQLQETLRRALHSHMRHKEAAFGDAISYLGQAVCIAALIPLHLLNIERVFAILALTSALAAMVQIMQVGLVRVAVEEVVQHSKEFLSYGKFLAANNLTVIITTLGYSWVITWTHGTAAVAELYAILTMLKPVSPLVNGITSLIVPTAARVNETEGPSAAGRAAAKFAWLGAAMLLPYLAIMTVAPMWAMGLVLGSRSTYLGDANVLRMYVAQAILSYGVSTIAAYFNAIHHSRLALYAQLGNTVGSLVVGLPLAWVGGLPGAAAGTLLAVAAQLAMLLHFRGKIQLRIPKFDLQNTPLRLPIRKPIEPLRKAA